MAQAYFFIIQGPDRPYHYKAGTMLGGDRLAAGHAKKIFDEGRRR
jgi:hypothetical protein